MATLAPLPKFQFLSNNGTPLAGGKLFTYLGGTTTKLATYTDATGSTPNTNPIILDSAGRCDCWLDPAKAYKFTLSPSTDTDPPTNALWTVDGVTPMQLTGPWSVAGGTVDAITAVYNPPNSALTDGLLLAFRALGANTVTTPTFAPDGLTPKTITRSGGVALAPGDIPGALAECWVRYNLANTRWELVNPATIANQILTPAQITSNQNNYGPLNLSITTQLRLSTDASRNITGLTTGSAGRQLTVMNVGTFPIVFKLEDGGSTAANRFSFGATLGGGQTMQIEYDGTTSRWKGLNIPDPLGTIKDFMSALPDNFLAIDQNVSRTTYASLFNVIGTTFGAGDGATTFGLFLQAGAALIAAGTGTQSESFVNADVDTAADTINVPSNSRKWITGKPVVVAYTSGSITGLAAGSYWIIRNSTTTVKFATTLANAQNGTAIDLTAKSTPIGTFTFTAETRTLGEQLGEQEHAQSSTELLSHIHGGGSVIVGGATWGSTGSITSASITATGGNAAANVTPLATVVTRGVKFV